MRIATATADVRNLARGVVALVVGVSLSCGSEAARFDDEDGARPSVTSTVVAAPTSDLPAAGTPDVGGIRLPPGRPLFGRYWITDEKIPDARELWRSLAASFPTTGLWPVLVENYVASKVSPWYEEDSYEPVTPSQVDSIDPATVFARLWRDADLDEELREPLGPSFEGLAVPTAVQAPTFVNLLAGSYRLLLAAVDRPADVVAVTGWATEAVTAAEATAVLRSWEDRFQWYVHYLRPDVMEVVIGEVSLSDQERYRLAGEVYVFAPSIMSDEYYPISELAEIP